MKYPCNIIIDLLPSYIDNLTSEETNKVIENHLEECEQCRMIYDQMKDKTLDIKNDNVDYLKKIKNYHKKRVRAVVIVIVVILSILTLAKKYYLPYEIYPDYKIEIALQEENKSYFNVYSDKNTSYQFKKHKLKVDEYGNYHIVMYGTQTIFKNDNHSYSGEVNLDELEGLLFLGDRYIDAEGYQYNTSTVEMINHRIQYVGDNSGVGKLLKLALEQLELETNQSFSDMKFSLQTDKEPYSITVEYNYNLTDLEKELISKKIEEVLSCIDNCNIAYIKDAVSLNKIEYDLKVRSYDDFKNQPKKELMTQLSQILPDEAVKEMEKEMYLYENRDDQEVIYTLGNKKENPTLRYDFVYQNHKLVQYVNKEYGFMDSLVSTNEISIEDAKKLATCFATVFLEKDIDKIKVVEPISGYEEKEYVTLEDNEKNIYVISLKQKDIIKFESSEYKR